MTESTIFYSVKGGQGTTLVAAAYALTLAETQPVVLKTHDPADTLAMLGAPEKEGPCWHEVGPNLVVTDLASDPSKIDHFTEVYDLGTNPTEIPAGRRLLVLRPCYLALRKALKASGDPQGFVLVTEPQRALQRADVEDVLGLKTEAVIPWMPSIATAVDAGLLAGRMPSRLRSVMRAMEPVR